MTKDSGPRIGRSRQGAALIAALWVILILSVLISGFAFDMHIEAGVTSYQRKRLKAQYLANAGVEYAKLLLAKSSEADKDDQAGAGEDETLLDNAIRFQRGVSVSGMKHELGEGSFTLDIIPEEGRRNLNTLTREDWEELLDQTNVPQEKWDELRDCFADWVDPGDEHQLNGAESDDEFYEERGYKCKNAALDTVDELLLIKGFDEGIVYGRPAEEGEDAPLLGIAPHLTVWGDGKVNINTATKEVMMTIPGLDEYMVEDIIRGRSGLDGKDGTRDDGWESPDEAISSVGLPDGVRDKITTTDKKFVRVISIGEVYSVRSGIWAVLQYAEGKVVPVYWREEAMP